MIDENRLFNEIAELYPMETLSKDEEMLVQDIYEIIDELSKVNEWIPVTERLPDEKGLYLVTYHPCYWDNVKEDVLVGIDNFMGKNLGQEENTKEL